MPLIEQNLNQNTLDDRLQEKHHNKPLFFSALVISLVILIFSIWYGYDNQVQQARDEETSRLIAKSALGTIDETANWKTYRNEEYGFEFKYPNGWMAKKENESNCDKDDNGKITCWKMFVELSPVEEKNGPWFLVSEGNCGGIKQNEWQIVGPSKDEFLSKYICSNGLSIAIDLFNDNPKKDFYVKTLDQILSTFKFISTSTPK